MQAVVDWYGPTEDFLKMDEELKASGCGVPDHSAPESPESLLLGRVDHRSAGTCAVGQPDDLCIRQHPTVPHSAWAA